jgi:hypothetical protein
MSLRLICLVFLAWSWVQAMGSADFGPSGARAAGMGKASVLLQDVWAVQNNPAATAWLKSPTAGLFCENRFLLQELSSLAVCMVLPTPAGSFGLNVSSFGFSLYQEIKAGVGYARKFGKSFSAGIQLDYYRFHYGEGYGSRNTISCEAGFLFQASKKVMFGLHIQNPVPVFLSRDPDVRLPLIIRMGLGYAFSESFLIMIEAEKGSEQKLIIRTGGEFKFARTLSIRAGFSTNPILLTVGAGLEFGKTRIDISSGYHQILGFIPAVSLSYNFKR